MLLDDLSALRVAPLVVRYTYQQGELPNNYLSITHDDMINNIIRFKSKSNDKRSVHDLYYSNIYNLGVVPLNF